VKDKIEFLRKDVMRVAVKNKKGHIAPSLSCLDILAVLKYEPEFKDDTIILSKAHGGYGLYAIEADLGQISKDDWENFNLCGTYDGLGSLGQGLPIGVGLSFGRKLQSLPGHVFVIVGDGELQEGSNWEALLFMRHYNLKNITVIVDNNCLQAIDRVDDVMVQELDYQFRGWGFEPLECDGHNYDWLLTHLRAKPQVVIARTIKGKGFPLIENNSKFHYRIPTESERHYGG
jgi:transketolase